MNWLPDTRREQGTCKPPEKATTVYRVRCGSPCYVRRVANISNGAGPWFAYHTTHTSNFENYEAKTGRRFTFRQGDFEIQVSERYVDIT